jgi:hypothetical protein
VGDDLDEGLGVYVAECFLDVGVVTLANEDVVVPGHADPWLWALATVEQDHL